MFRKLFLPFLFVCYSGILFSQTTLPKLVITKVTPGVYVYTTYGKYKSTYVPSNSMYVVTKAGVVMIDVPWDSTQFQPLLDSIEKKHHQKVAFCIATHFHEDRTAALDFLKSQGVKTYSSVLTKQLCKEHGEKAARFTFKNDTTFHVGEDDIQTFYPGGGHTKDNLVIWLPKEKILYGGCFIKSVEAADLGNLEDADIKAWPGSLNKVQRKFPNAEYVITGHQSWKDKNSLQHTLKLLSKQHRGK